MIDAEHLQKFGYARLDNILDTVMVEELFAASREIFSLDSHMKARYLRGDNDFGYTPPGIERIGGSGPDQHREFWDVGSRQPNRFPPEAKEFGRLTLRLHVQMERQSRTVLQTLDRSWGTSIVPLVEHACMPMRVTKYSSLGEGSILAARHRDFSLTTFYVASDSPGLEFEVGGDWIRPEHPPGSVLVGVGTTLKKFYSAARPLPHRVVDVGRERISISFFSELSRDAHLPDGRRASEYMHMLNAHVRGL